MGSDVASDTSEASIVLFILFGAIAIRQMALEAEDTECSDREMWAESRCKQSRDQEIRAERKRGLGVVSSWSLKSEHIQACNTFKPHKPTESSPLFAKSHFSYSFQSYTAFNMVLEATMIV